MKRSKILNTKKEVGKLESELLAATAFEANGEITVIAAIGLKTRDGLNHLLFSTNFLPVNEMPNFSSVIYVPEDSYLKIANNSIALADEEKNINAPYMKTTSERLKSGEITLQELIEKAVPLGNFKLTTNGVIKQ